MSETSSGFDDRTWEAGIAGLTDIASAAALRLGVPTTTAATAAIARFRVRFAISLPPRERRRETAVKTGIRKWRRRAMRIEGDFAGGMGACEVGWRGIRLVSDD